MFLEYVKWRGGGEAYIVSNCENSFFCRAEDFDSMIENCARETANNYLFGKDSDWILNHLDWEKIEDELKDNYYLSGDYVFYEYY